SGNASIAGYVKDAATGEPITGAVVSVDSPFLAVQTDRFGYYSVQIPRGRRNLTVSFAGMKEGKRQLMVYADGKLDVELVSEVPTLRTVVVMSERQSHVRAPQMGVERLNIRTVKQIPAIMGEADVLRVVLSLPGVTSVGEGSTGMNVRGGSADQNLILFNDATIYNPSHLFGFFTAFNPDVIKSVELYKSSIPERYGGRLSSVLEVNGREGNAKKFSGSGGIGLLTSKLTLEGPIVKDKATFIMGGRTTYSNWLLAQLPDRSYRNSRASFFDGNAQITLTPTAKDQIYLSGYMSGDRFRFNDDTTYQYGNRNFYAKWKHTFHNRLSGVVTAGTDDYRYEMGSRKLDVNAFRSEFSIRQLTGRAEFTYTGLARHEINIGAHTIRYRLNPGTYLPDAPGSLVTPDRLQQEQGQESALYLGDRIQLGDRLSLQAGLRYSMFQYLGPQRVLRYAPGVPKEAASVLDSIAYGKGSTISTYHGPEYRASLRYSLSDSSSVKFSFNTLRQYIHMLSNTLAIAPTDTWKLSDGNIRPQSGYQVSAGYYRTFSRGGVEASVEVYFKRGRNFLDYKSGAQLTMNHFIERDVISTRGRAYGGELMLRKMMGKLNGWVSYTYSRTWLQDNDPLSRAPVNKGRWYPASYDKPHTLNFIGNFRFSHRLSASMNVVYSSGRPVTLPIAMFRMAGAQRVYYSDRNAYRIPDYFRTDFSLNIEGNHKIKKLKHSSWSLGVYNMLARQNVYTVYFVQEASRIKGYKLSIFGTAIPFITYNFRF
ncbi:MAG TPA: TonB-dependent receptor, partial [Chitinophagaceae bacterium]|nr:TonB-dependent receptor [Chitinophagaceae bacterium]